MESDDRQVGRILSRREALKLLGVAGAVLLAGCAPEQLVTGQPPGSPPQATSTADLSTPRQPAAGEATSAPAQATSSVEMGTPAQPATLQPTGAPAQGLSTANPGAMPSCVVRPEMTEGPYFVDEDLNRSDVRTDPAIGAMVAGAPLVLTFRVSQVGAGGCTPLAGAKVDIWHCDAAGVYSDVADPRNNTVGQKFLRGYQVTDANGQAAFTTIYPGWYPGRTVHIHFKVRHDTSPRSLEFTSQLFFDDLLSDQVFTQPPYAARGPRNTRNNADGIYNDVLLLAVTPAGQGYSATFDIGLQTA
jgi:protocatechuate 3,4-dioxygenase beta subunit